MYNVSSQFHTAVMTPSPPEKIKLTFADGAVLYNDYVKGFDYDEAVCEDTDLTVGSTIGAQLTIHIFKDETEFQDFDFSGQYFEAELGVKIGNSYEYCPLGTFRAEKPETARITSLTLTAYDKMRLFDVPLDGFIDTVTFPKTAKQLFTALCTYIGVTASTADFINSGKIFTELSWPAESTCREFLSMIAELACSFARMSRDDVCELVWFTPTGVELTKEKYTSRRNAEYAVKRIDKLQVKVVDDDIGCIVGDGTNAYIIVDNPLLYGASDAEIRQYAQPIYDRLNAWNPIIPAEVNARCDWSLQAGDVIKVGAYKQYGYLTSDGDIYTTVDGEIYCVQGIDEYDGMIDVPIFSQHIHWNGGATVQYVSSGSQQRPVLNAQNRREYRQNKAYHLMEVSVDRLNSEIYDGEGHSKIEQLADEITLAVDGVTDADGKITAASIMLAINGDESEIKIAADKVAISGVVTFENLQDGETIISGSNIKAGTIAAEYIDVENLSVKHLDGADGTFSGSLAANVSITSPTIVGGTIISGTDSGSKLEITGGEVGVYYNNSRVGNIHGEYYNGVGSCLFVNGLSALRLSVGGDPQITIGSTISVGAELTSGYTGRFYDFAIGNSAAVSSIGTAAVLEQDGAYYYLARSGSRRDLKTNIRGLPYAGEVHKLRPVLYRPKKNDSGVDYAGFIAEEMESACPVLTTYDGDGEILGVQYDRVCAYLVAEAQQAKRERDELARKIVELEGKTS